MLSWWSESQLINSKCKDTDLWCLCCSYYGVVRWWFFNPKNVALYVKECIVLLMKGEMCGTRLREKRVRTSVILIICCFFRGIWAFLISACLLFCFFVTGPTIVLPCTICFDSFYLVFIIWNTYSPFPYFSVGYVGRSIVLVLEYKDYMCLKEYCCW